LKQAHELELWSGSRVSKSEIVTIFMALQQATKCNIFDIYYTFPVAFLPALQRKLPLKALSQKTSFTNHISVFT
jgi:hypothetical protein